MRSAGLGALQGVFEIDRVFVGRQGVCMLGVRVILTIGFKTLLASKDPSHRNEAITQNHDAQGKSDVATVMKPLPM